MRNKIIGYVSAEDPFRDKKAWSGTKYKIREALQNAGYEAVSYTHLTLPTKLEV